MCNAANILCPIRKEQEESQPHFIFFCKLSKTTLDFMNELINFNYSSEAIRSFLPNSIMVYSQNYTTHTFKSVSQASFQLP